MRTVDAVQGGFGSIFDRGASAAAAMTSMFYTSPGPEAKYHPNEYTPLSSDKRVAAQQKKLARKRRAQLRRARQNYIDSQTAYVKSQELYQTLTDRDREQKSRFNEIQMELQKLAREDVKIVSGRFP